LTGRLFGAVHRALVALLDQAVALGGEQLPCPIELIRVFMLKRKSSRISPCRLNVDVSVIWLA
jgi:hypothetical protein